MQAQHGGEDLQEAEVIAKKNTDESHRTMREPQVFTPIKFEPSWAQQYLPYVQDSGSLQSAIIVLPIDRKLTDIWPGNQVMVFISALVWP